MNKQIRGKLYSILLICNVIFFHSIGQDKQTEYPGGLPKFYEYVKNNLKYPKDAKQAGISGRVFIGFTVAADGTIEDATIEIVKSLHPSCDNEAIRLIKECKKWNPSINGGKPVRQKIVLPIIFD
ncbi:MAG: energy transducer TonB [Cyclobacteriaceae bacterium]